MTSKFPEFIVNGLKLRPIIDEDLHNIHRGLSDPEVTKYYGVHFHTLESAKTQMNWYKELKLKQLGIWWAIGSTSSNEFYGAIGFNNWEKINRKAEIGFWVLPEYWGIGVIKKTIKEILSYGFEVMNLHRIEALVETENFKSKSILEQNNFSYEGTLVDYEVKNENFISIDIFALLESNYSSK